MIPEPTAEDLERCTITAFSPLHPHEPEIPSAFDAEGRCLVCCLLVRVKAAEKSAFAAEREVKRQNGMLLAIAREIGERLPLNVQHRSAVDALRWFSERLQTAERERDGLLKYKEDQTGFIVLAASKLILADVPESAGAGVLDAINWIISQRDELRAEVERLHKRMVELHSVVCTSDNCVLDGGAEHAECFSNNSTANVCPRCDGTGKHSWLGNPLAGRCSLCKGTGETHQAVEGSR